MPSDIFPTGPIPTNIRRRAVFIICPPRHTPNEIGATLIHAPNPAKTTQSVLAQFIFSWGARGACARDPNSQKPGVLRLTRPRSAASPPLRRRHGAGRLQASRPGHRPTGLSAAPSAGPPTAASLDRIGDRGELPGAVRPPAAV